MTTARRSAVRLADLLEAIVGVAIVAALVRDVLNDPRAASRMATAPGSEWVRLIGGATLTGLAIAGGLGLALESIRGRRRGTWGLGRWIWSASAGFVAINLGTALVHLVATQRRLNAGAVRGEVVLGLVRYYVANGLLSDFAWALAALCLTSMFARSPTDPEPDAREWLGRAYASLVIGTMIGLRTLQAMGD